MVLEKKQNSIKSTKPNSPTANTGATHIPTTGDSFMNFETSQKISGQDVSVTFEGTNKIQVSKRTF